MQLFSNNHILWLFCLQEILGFSTDYGFTVAGEVFTVGCVMHQHENYHRMLAQLWPSI